MGFLERGDVPLSPGGGARRLPQCWASRLLSTVVQQGGRGCAPLPCSAHPDSALHACSESGVQATFLLVAEAPFLVPFLAAPL